MSVYNYHRSPPQPVVDPRCVSDMQQRRPKGIVPSCAVRCLHLASIHKGLTSLLVNEFRGNVASCHDKEQPNNNERGSPDELNDYLALLAADMHTTVITWWREHRDTFRNLNKIARQYLGCPATSTGVECLLSAVGLTFSDLAKAMDEETLAARLMAAYNYRLDMYLHV